jgi:hypothetical protein
MAAVRTTGLANRIWNWIRALGPYQSLALLALPACMVEPLKLFAIAVAGEGHWFTGIGMIIAAYAASVLIIERLFAVVKPRLLKLRWFAKLWARVVDFRYKITKTLQAQ